MIVGTLAHGHARECADVSATVIVTFVVAFAGTVARWWLYVDRVAERRRILAGSVRRRITSCIR
jgi:hypothetical protein